MRVYRQLSSDHTVARYYGCVKRTSRTFRFDWTLTNSGEAFDFHLSGYIVGYALNYLVVGGDSSEAYVASYNVKARQRLRFANATSSPSQFNDVDKLLMTPKGELAWTSDSFALGPTAPPRNYEVHLFAGSDRLVDSGGDIDPRSLVLSNMTLTWIRAHAVKTAAI